MFILSDVSPWREWRVITSHRTPWIITQCRSIPINADQNYGLDPNVEQCRSSPLNSSQCWSIPINTNQCQIKQHWSGISDHCQINTAWCGIDQHWEELIGIGINSIILLSIYRDWALIEGVLFTVIDIPLWEWLSSMFYHLMDSEEGYKSCTYIWWWLTWYVVTLTNTQMTFSALYF